jgi:hypothetical protein
VNLAFTALQKVNVLLRTGSTNKPLENVKTGGVYPPRIQE